VMGNDCMIEAVAGAAHVAPARAEAISG